MILQGTHPSLKSNTNAKATVTAIIDGTGSLGAAVGPLLVGLITRYSVKIIINKCIVTVMRGPLLVILITHYSVKIITVIGDDYIHSVYRS